MCEVRFDGPIPLGLWLESKDHLQIVFPRRVVAPTGHHTPTRRAYSGHVDLTFRRTCLRVLPVGSD